MENKELVLIKDCQSGNAEAFGQLYDKYFKKIYRFVYYKVGQKEATEDLVSNIFIKALESIQRFKVGKGTFSAWLYRIARNTVIDYYRTNKQVVNLDDILEPSIENNMSTNLDISISLSEVKEKMSQLTEQQQEIIILRVWEGLSYKEIAEIIGKSEASCKMAFSRSIKELRLSLGSLLLLITLIN